MKIVHLVNVLTPREGSDLVLAQPITLESLRLAKKAAHEIDIQLFSAQFEEDRCKVPDWITPTADLKASSLDHEDFLDKRKLPSLAEIWDRLISNSSEADLIIYSNIDIAVRPNFYSRVAELMNQEWDAISITRRTISKNKYTCLTQLDQMIIDDGEAHPGDDCFVFRRDRVSQLRLSPVYVGAAWFDKIILINLAWKTKFSKFRDEILTFHIGDDRTWVNPKTKTVADWNKALLRSLILELEQDVGKVYRNQAIWQHVKTIYAHAGFQTSLFFRAKIAFSQLIGMLARKIRTSPAEQ